VGGSAFPLAFFLFKRASVGRDLFFFLSIVIRRFEPSLMARQRRKRS
jgi:hypothetical protein